MVVILGGEAVILGHIEVTHIILFVSTMRGLCELVITVCDSSQENVMNTHGSFIP